MKFSDSPAIRQIFDNLKQELGVDIYAVFLRAGKDPGEIKNYLIGKDLKFESGHLSPAVCIIDKEIAEEVTGPEYMSIFEKSSYRFLQEEIVSNPKLRFQKIEEGQIPVYMAEMKKLKTRQLGRKGLNRFYGTYKKDDPFKSSHFDGRIPDVEPIEESNNVVKPLRF
jgi:hypothetical protein